MTHAHNADHVRSGDWWKDIPDKRPDIREQCKQWPCDAPPAGCGALQGDPCTHEVRRTGQDGKPVVVRERRRMPCLCRLKKVEGPKLL
jgi:hypothetical protein